VVTKW